MMRQSILALTNNAHSIHGTFITKTSTNLGLSQLLNNSGSYVFMDSHYIMLFQPSKTVPSMSI